MPYRDKEEALKNRREWYWKNRESVLKRERERYKKNPTKSNENSRRWRKNNPDKVLQYTREWYARNIERQRERSRETARRQVQEQFKISPQQHDRILASPCGICGGKTKHLDHCHSTGRLRGGLCTRCNLMLGQMDDNPILLRNAIKLNT